MKSSVSSFPSLFKDSLTAWNNDKAPTLAAALAYYSVFSLGPLLLVILSVLGIIFGKNTAQGQIFEQLGGFLGREGASSIEGMIRNANKPTTGIVSLIIGTIMLILGASGIFGQLKGALNDIWGVKAKPGGGVISIFRERFLSLGMLAVICFLLVISLVASASVTAVSTFLKGFLPFSPFILETINFFVSLGVVAFLFSFIFKVLPDIKISWKTVLPGAFITSLLFTLGKTLIGIYIGRSNAATTYGAAGSIVTILLWVYYSAQILFFGAEFIKVYAEKNNIKISPSEYGVLDEEIKTVVTQKSRVKISQKFIPIFIGYLLGGFAAGVTRRGKLKSFLRK